jgi:hypothetical protein
MNNRLDYHTQKRANRRNLILFPIFGAAAVLSGIAMLRKAFGAWVDGTIPIPPPAATGLESLLSMLWAVMPPYALPWETPWNIFGLLVWSGVAGFAAVTYLNWKVGVEEVAAADRRARDAHLDSTR